MENTVQCPVHGEKLEIGPKIITFMGMHYNALEGRCPKCRMVYLDQKIKGIARFTYEGANYQYLPELESWRIEQEQRKEKEQKKAEVKRKIKERYPFLKSRVLKIRISPNKSKRCPEHGNKLSGLIGKLSDCDNNELITLDGCYCPQCNALYLNPDAKESVERYSHNAQLKLDIKFCGEGWEQMPRIGVSEIQYPTNPMKRGPKTTIKITETMLNQYPFLRNGKIAIKALSSEQITKCPVHRNDMKKILCHLREKQESWIFEFTGYYCSQCNCIYLKKSTSERMMPFVIKTSFDKKEYIIVPQWKNKYFVKVSSWDFPQNKVNRSVKSKKEKDEQQIKKTNNTEMFDLDELEFKLSAYQKFDREIVEVLATVDGTEKYIRVLTFVKDEDKRKCAANEILERESTSVGRELLGRIAHNQLDEFASKIGTIKIHNYKVWPGQEYHLDGFTKFCNPDEIQDITIMSQKNLDRNSEEYEMVTALVYCANREEPVYIDVYYSQQQNRYFINDESYRLYRTRYGLPYVHLVPGQYDGDMDYGNLRQYSELNLYGYTVAKAADMTSGERQQLLQQLMDNGLMSKHQIVNHLEWLIHRQSGRISMEDACDCWKEDLRFVNNYRIQNQRKIRGHFVYGTKTLKH